MKTYDVVILGAGPAGYVGALRAGQKGASAAVVEKGDLGGVCLNEGCIPTKALLDVCHTVHRVGSLSKSGAATGDVSVELAGAVDGKDAMVKKLRGGVEFLLKGRKVDVVRGTGTVSGPGEIGVEGAEPVGFKSLVIATGSRPIELPGMAFDEQNVISSAGALGLREVPESIVVVGGGYIGCEFADLFASLGSKVTVVEMLEDILPGVDPDLAAVVRSGLEKSGVELLTGTKVEKAEVSDGAVAVELSSGESRTAAKVLVCVGRRPNTDIGDLAGLGVGVGGGGIDVDERCATACEGVYAAGDVTGIRMLAHVASRQAEVAVENALGNETEIDYATVPDCVFTTPEIASVGMTEAAAAEEGLEVRTAKFPFAALGRAVVTGDDKGMVKIVGGTEGDVIGMQIAGRGASEMIALGGLAIQVGATVEDLAEMIVMHPTFSEAIREAAEVWVGRPLHTGG
jgi:dihydrolipoamide dehydrogenase